MGVHPRPPVALADARGVGTQWGRQPHSDQGIGEKRQIVGFYGLSSVGTDILPYPMPYFAGVYGNHNGNRPTLPLRPQQLLERRVVAE